MMEAQHRRQHRIAMSLIDWARRIPAILAMGDHTRKRTTTDFWR